ncbi:hypothetical protein L1887_60001 [Cichorium endivia]|nr:hypothetical protein L1887_60001 [Cichorium endivia]
MLSCCPAKRQLVCLPDAHQYKTHSFLGKTSVFFAINLKAMIVLLIVTYFARVLATIRGRSSSDLACGKSGSCFQIPREIQRRDDFSEIKGAPQYTEPHF